MDAHMTTLSLPFDIPEPAPSARNAVAAPSPPAAPVRARGARSANREDDYGAMLAEHFGPEARPLLDSYLEAMGPKAARIVIRRLNGEDVPPDLVPIADIDHDDRSDLADEMAGFLADHWPAEDRIRLCSIVQLAAKGRAQRLLKAMRAAAVRATGSGAAP